VFAVIALALVILGAAGWGAAGFLVTFGVIGLATASHALLTGRRTWALIPSRMFAAGALASCLVMTSFGAALTPARVADAANLTASIGADASGLASDLASNLASDLAATLAAPSSLESATSAAAAPTVADRVRVPAVAAKVTMAGPQVAPPVIAQRTVVGTTANALLATLRVKGKAAGTGYARTVKFGTAWLDVDRNGCDTRNDILARDLTADVMRGRCTVIRGTLRDPYTGTTIKFVRGNKTSTLVQIDHAVALQNSWLTGAQLLSQDQRVAFANDPLNLVAVDGRTNSVKGADDAATWLPPKKSYRCVYVTRQIEVKAKYRLWIAPAERDAMARVLRGCPGQRATQPKPITVAPIVRTPAPAPAVPVTAPTIKNIHPGSWCSPKGAIGTADTGRTYVCGRKGADAVGKFHWNS